MSSPEASESIASDTKSPPEIRITIGAYDAARLMTILEIRVLAVANRDNSEAVRLYEVLATALNDGHTVKLVHRDNPDPKYRPQEKDTQSQSSSVAKPQTPPPRPSFWRRFWNGDLWS